MTSGTAPAEATASTMANASRTRDPPARARFVAAWMTPPSIDGSE